MAKIYLPPLCIIPSSSILLITARGNGIGAHVLEHTCTYSRHLANCSMPLALAGSSLQKLLLNLSFSFSSKHQSNLSEVHTHLLEGEAWERAMSGSRDELWSLIYLCFFQHQIIIFVIFLWAWRCLMNEVSLSLSMPNHDDDDDYKLKLCVVKQHITPHPK